MKRKTRKTIWMALRAAICILSIVGGSSIAIGSANAQDEVRKFSDRVGELVNNTSELMNAEDHQTALNVMQQEIFREDLNPFERSTLYQMIGQSEYELDRLIPAQAAFENAITSGGLLPHEEANVVFVIAQLRFSKGHYREGAERLEAHLKASAEPNAKHVKLLAQAWLQAQEYERALPWAETSLEMFNPTDLKSYDLLNFLYAQLGMRDEQFETLTRMIELWPEDDNLFRALASALSDADRDEDAFEVTKMLYLRGALTNEVDLVRLVQNYSFYEMPYQAAEILEQEMTDNRISTNPVRLKQLAGLFRQAREYERAIPYVEAAAEGSDDVGILTQLAQWQYDVKACQEAETAFQAAVDRGYDAGKAQMLIGNCYYDQSETHDRLSCNLTDEQWQTAPKSVSRDAALKAFEAVPETSRESGNAKKWMQFIGAEIQADESRCYIGYDVQRELCYQKIKQAYDAVIFTGGFKLEDETCQKFVADYNSKFRAGYSEK